MIDPTVSSFTINTVKKGNFPIILNLVNFKYNNFTDDEIEFISEIIEKLNNNSIEVKANDINSKLTIDNVFELIQHHQICQQFYSKRLKDEIDFISSHFYEIKERMEKEIFKLKSDIIYKIFANPKLQLETEDQLLAFINEIYSKESTFSILYETVIFENVSSEKMKEFIEKFDFNDMTSTTWQRLTNRLQQEIKNVTDELKSSEGQYKKASKVLASFKYTNKEFSGIINFLREKSSKKIENEISITSTSYQGNSGPLNVTIHEDQRKYFNLINQENNWICFDFKDYRVIPTDYTMKSRDQGKGWCHPKSWVLEGSNDNISFEILDEEKYCPYLNGNNLAHTFKIKNQTSKEFRYIRLYATGKDWWNSNYFSFSSFEIYGQLIKAKQ